MKKFFSAIAANKMCYSLLFISITLSLLIMSIGISNIEGTKKNVMEESDGNYQYSYTVNISFNTNVKFSELLNSINKDLTSFNIEIPIIESTNSLEAKHQLIFKKANYDTDWHPPLMNGKYFKNGGNQNLIVVGKNIESVNANLEIFNVNFKVLGTVGYKDHGTKWDDNIYIPLDSYSSKFDNFINSSSIQLLIKTNMRNNSPEIETFKNDVRILDDECTVSIIQNDIVQSSSLNGQVTDIKNTVVKIWLIAILNILVMSFLILGERSKEIALLKIFGYNYFYITGKFLIEMFFLCAVSVIFMFPVQYAITSVANKLYDLRLDISFTNIKAAVLLAVITILVTTISSLAITLQVKAIKILKG